MESNFANNLKMLRKERGITQEELARNLNVVRQSVSQWENNTSSPNVNLLILLSNYFNVSIDQLVKGKVDNEVIVIEESLY